MASRRRPAQRAASWRVSTSRIDRPSPAALLPNENPTSPTAIEFCRNELPMKGITSPTDELSAAARSIGENAATTLSQRLKEREAALRLAPSYQVMFVLVALCGLGTLGGFLLQRSSSS